MLIELFTNGNVLIDGEMTNKSYKPEEVLFDYLTDPSKFTMRSSGKNQKAA